MDNYIEEKFWVVIVPDVPKYQSDSENESWGDSEDDDSNDDDSDDVSKHDNDDDDADSDGDGDNDASDIERTDSDKEEETQDDEYVHTPDYYVPTDEETNDENNEFDDEEYDELYKDVNARSKVKEHEEVRKGDAKMTDVARESVSQEKSYEKVIKDAHVTLTSSQKTEGSKQSSSTSSEFASKFITLDNVPPVNDEVAFMMNAKVCREELSTQAPSLLSIHVTAIPETSIVPATTVPPTIQPFTPSQAKKDRYIDLVEKSIKDIIKDEVKSQLPQILPKEVSDFASPVIQSAINESLENVVLAKSSSQPKSTYEAAVSLPEFELMKILLDKMQKSKSDREDKYKDEDSPGGSDEGLKKRKTKEPLFEGGNTEMSQDQGGDLGDTEDQPNVKVALKHDWFKKPKRPSTPNPAWNAGKLLTSDRLKHG
uniref:Uncharacterized protein n=1 Tax=Tanacetum cinerariifolium TaxID=118510 RepID=A0A6L2K1L5_TANCI|nr:hypothetical protein [Tanacetum cinerariifolium]